MCETKMSGAQLKMPVTFHPAARKYKKCKESEARVLVRQASCRAASQACSMSGGASPRQLGRMTQRRSCQRPSYGYALVSERWRHFCMAASTR